METSPVQNVLLKFAASAFQRVMMESFAQPKTKRRSDFGQQLEQASKTVQCAKQELKRMKDATTCTVEDAKLTGAGSAIRKPMNCTTNYHSKIYSKGVQACNSPSEVAGNLLQPSSLFSFSAAQFTQSDLFAWESSSRSSGLLRQLINYYVPTHLGEVVAALRLALSFAAFSCTF